MDSSIRLPLQVGTSAAGSVARAGALLLPGLAMTIGAVVLLVQAGEGFIWGVLLGVFGVQFAIVGALNARRAFRMWPADVLLSQEGLRFEGGRFGGRFIRWQELDPARCVLETSPVERFTVQQIFANVIFWVLTSIFDDKPEGAPPDKVTVYRLTLATQGGPAELVAEADAPDEQPSLRALHESIVAHVRPAGEDLGAAVDPRVLRCVQCSAPVVPQNQDQVACHYCRTPNAVPPQLRQQLVAQQQLESHRGAARSLVTQLLRQPGARRASAVLWLILLLTALAWTTLVGLGVLAIAHGITDVGFEVGWLTLNGWIFAVALYLFTRYGLVDRGALRLLTVGFAARAPAKAGDPHGCRVCGGPLVAASDQVLARCVFCQADNVLGIDLRNRADEDRKQQQSLEQALTQRKSRRRNWLFAAISSLGAAALSMMLISVTLDTVLIASAKDSDCEAGDVKACARVGEKYTWGEGAAEDYDKAAWALEKACKGGDERSCGILAGLYEDDDWGLPRDAKRCHEYNELGCKGGYELSCEDLKKGKCGPAPKAKPKTKSSVTAKPKMSAKPRSKP